jgi:hypothetical protein
VKLVVRPIIFAWQNSKRKNILFHTGLKKVLNVPGLTKIMPYNTISTSRKHFLQCNIEESQYEHIIKCNFRSRSRRVVEFLVSFLGSNLQDFEVSVGDAQQLVIWLYGLETLTVDYLFASVDVRANGGHSAGYIHRIKNKIKG